MAATKKKNANIVSAIVPADNNSQDIVTHLEEILAWLDTRFKLIESDKLPVKLYILKYLGFLNLLPKSMAKWEKALLLGVLLERNEVSVNKRLSKISYSDSIATQIKHLTLVLELFTRLCLHDHVKAVEKDIAALVKKSTLT